MILKRRSIRKYSSEPVPEEVRAKILEAGRQAPSAVNAQPWHFIVIDDPALKEKLASTGRWRSFVKDCSFVVVGLYKSNNPVTKRWGQVDTVIALQNMVLAAQVQGVGSCWIGDLSGDIQGLLENTRGRGDRRVGILRHPGRGARSEVQEGRQEDIPLQ